LRYLLKCCGRIVDTDNKPIWCIKCGRHDIEVVKYDEDTMLPCPFCGGEPMKEALNSAKMYWYECEECGASSGHAEDWTRAKKNWNMRR
jgi:Lar family restriction alleviation protein